MSSDIFVGLWDMGKKMLIFNRIHLKRTKRGSKTRRNFLRLRPKYKKPRLKLKKPSERLPKLKLRLWMPKKMPKPWE